MKVAFLTPEYPHAFTRNLRDQEPSYRVAEVAGVWSRSRCCFKDENVVIQCIKM
jgi:hypothetical protein